MKNFRGSALAAGVGTPESAPHELLGSSLRFYLVFKHRNCIYVNFIFHDDTGTNLINYENEFLCVRSYMFQICSSA